MPCAFPTHANAISTIDKINPFMFVCFIVTYN